MPLGIAALLVAVAALGPLVGLALGWWLHERVRALVEALPPVRTEGDEYESLLVPGERRQFALAAARRWSERAREDRERMGERRAG